MLLIGVAPSRRVPIQWHGCPNTPNTRVGEEGLGVAARTGRTSGRWRVVVMGGELVKNEMGEGGGAKGICVRLGGMEAGAFQGTMRSAGTRCRSELAPACGAKLGRSQASIKGDGRTIHTGFCFRSHSCMELVRVLE